jgi:hypothetical protein
MPRKTAALRLVADRSDGRATAARVQTPLGASAVAHEDKIVVRDPKGAIVVVYDSATGSATIAAPAGDLHLDAPHGKVVVSAGTDLELSASARASVSSHELEISTVRRASLRAALAQLTADAMEATAPEVALRVGRWQLSAERVVERVTDVYRDVGGMIETHAQQMRSLVRGATQWLSGSTSIVSKEDTFIDGRRVLLG